MFADTITVTINAVAKVLTRINQDNYCSEYVLRNATEEFRLNIRNTKYNDSKRGGVEVHRHNFELVQTVYPVAPATRSTIRKMYSVIENDVTDPLTDSLNFGLGFTGVLTSANLTKVLNWES